MSKLDLELLINQLPGKPHAPPVEHWHPPLSGAMDLCITRDGIWYHEGRPIERMALVRLFSSILRHDEDGAYYLVTPVERWRIQVELAPFLAVDLKIDGSGVEQILCFRTNVDDWVMAGPEHPIQVEYRAGSHEPLPFIHVRGRLRALLTRAVFYELADYADVREAGSGTLYSVWSQGVSFPLGEVC